MATIRKFEDIEAWQKARLLNKSYYTVVKSSPALQKDYALLDQSKRSAGSMMDNVAEGFGRGNTNEFIYFLGVANGSSTEFRSQLYRLLDQEYINQKQFDELYKMADDISAMLKRFTDYLNKTNLKGARYVGRELRKK